METTGTCARGHAVAPDAVLCTVCWVRLDGEDPDSKRARILNLVSRPVGVAVVGGIVLAAGVGGALILANPSTPAAVVAGGGASVTASPSASPSAADQPVVTSVPLAATVVSPVVTGPDGACVLDVLDQQAACRTEGDLVRFEVCVPADSEKVEVRTRATPDDEWTDATSDIVLLPGGGCSDNGRRADVALAAASFDLEGTDWRLVGRDMGGDRLWKSKLRPAAAGE